MNSISASREKRPRDADKENHVPQASTSTATAKKPRPSNNVYKTLPPPTTKLIQLRFQLTGAKGVFRIVQVPTNYTLANLHTLIQFIFGWNNDHLHQMHVYANVEMYSATYKPGIMKRYGCAPEPPADYLLPDQPEHVQEMMRYHWQISNDRAAVYEVVPQGRKKQTKYFDDFDVHTRIEDQELTIREIWNRNINKNASQGSYENDEIGIIYEYDLGASWMVHITFCESFYTADPPIRHPTIVTAKGAPPVEDCPEEIPDELLPKNKTVSWRIHQREAFERYCDGETRSRALKDRLDIYETQKGVQAREAREIEKAKAQDATQNTDANKNKSEQERAERRERYRQERQRQEMREQRRQERKLERQKEAERLALAEAEEDEEVDEDEVEEDDEDEDEGEDDDEDDEDQAEDEDEITDEDARAVILAVGGLIPAVAAFLASSKARRR